MTAPSASEWILRLLVGSELTAKEMFERMQQDGYGGAFATVKRKLELLEQTQKVRVVRRIGPFKERVFAIAAAPRKRGMPDQSPLGIIPTRKHDPIGWIVVTSGAELEAA